MLPLVLILMILALAGALGWALFLKPVGAAVGGGHDAPPPTAGRDRAATRPAGTPNPNDPEGTGIGPTVRLPDFVIHLQNPEGDRYARISFELELDTEKDKAAITPNLPRIRDSFITYLSDRTLEELRGSKGLERTKQTLLKQLEEMVPGRVRNVFITDFVVQ
jgi:flagellar FliL protein